MQHDNTKLTDETMTARERLFHEGGSSVLNFIKPSQLGKYVDRQKFTPPKEAAPPCKK